MTAFIGIDLAWSTTARTGLAALDAEGRLTQSGAVRTDAEIDDWLALHAPGTVDVVAVDAPLIVPNPTGQRQGERLVTAAYGRFDAGCHASNTGQTSMNPPRATELARRHGWSPDPEAPGPGTCIEVYPHPAMVGLFGLGRILPYKAKSRRSLATRHAAMNELLRHLESIRPLELPANERWHQITTAVRLATRPVDLGRVEDEIDAILCAHLAWLWRHQPGTLQVYGTTDTGYIVAPPPPAHQPTPRPAKSEG